MEIWAVNPHESTCAGETVSFEAEVTGAEAEFVIEWSDKDNQFLDDSEHFSLNENKTVLTINNALPPHAGLYYVAVKYVNEPAFHAYESFQLEVQGILISYWFSIFSGPYSFKAHLKAGMPSSYWLRYSL